MRPRLLYVCLWDAADRNSESGYAYSMRAQLSKRFDVVDLFPLELPGENLFLPLRAAYKAIGRYYHPMREPGVLKSLARRIEQTLKNIRPDVVFAPSSIPLSFVETACPSVYATDQLFCDFINTYIPSPSERFQRLGNAQEARALARASRVSYPSAWAARSATEHYSADPGKLDVIPWGANLPQAIDRDGVEAAIAQRPADSCHLVFLGRDWHRKGGDILVGTVTALNELGLPTRATIIGCQPAGLPAHLFEIHPFLDKGNPEHFARLTRIMRDAHFLFLPSRAEAYGQVFCEAAAFGVPSIGSTVGGIPTIIRDAETGFVRAPETPASEFAALIRDTLADPTRYRGMARLARDDFEQRLNWDSFGERLNSLVLGAI
jgi:glycosyltransferase involved in cell wall biosynthesis